MRGFRGCGMFRGAAMQLRWNLKGCRRLQPRTPPCTNALFWYITQMALCRSVSCGKIWSMNPATNFSRGSCESARFIRIQYKVGLWKHSFIQLNYAMMPLSSFWAAWAHCVFMLSIANDHTAQGCKPWPRTSASSDGIPGWRIINQGLTWPHHCQPLEKSSSNLSQIKYIENIVHICVGNLQQCNLWW